MTKTMPTYQRDPTSRASVALLVFAVAGAFGLLALLDPGLRSPGFVARVSVQNRNPWHVHVELSDGDRQGWLGPGSVSRGQTRNFSDVLDQGDTWLFRFTYGGHHGGELVVTRAQLAGANWTIVVPEDFVERMKRAGVADSAG